VVPFQLGRDSVPFRETTLFRESLIAHLFAGSRRRAISSDEQMETASEQPGQPLHSLSLRVAWISGGLPLIVGSMAFAWWWFSRGNLPILLGIAAVTAGPVLVVVGVACLILARRQQPRVSRKKILGAGLLLFSNFPVAWGYWTLVDAEVTTNRYRLVNQTGSPVQHLVLRHRDRQIGVCEQLEDGASVEFFFSALNNGGEGPISFTGRQGQQTIGGETGVMAFVFTKSHVEIILQPDSHYRVRVQEFIDGRPKGSIQEAGFRNL